MFDAQVGFSSVYDLSTRVVNQIKYSLNMEVINDLALVGAACWTIAKHELDALYHHFYESFNNRFMDKNIVRTDAGLAGVRKLSKTDFVNSVV
jgi:hypothetical protein